MNKRNYARIATLVIAALGVLGLVLEHGSRTVALASGVQGPGGPVVTIGAPLPLSVTGSVGLARSPAHDGQFFDITQPAGPPFVDALSLTVPAGVVLTDAHATFSIPESVPNAASLIVRHGSAYFVYQIVNSTTFNAGVDLESGVLSDGDLKVELSCYNIAGNHCQGALMWSGYTTP